MHNPRVFVIGLILAAGAALSGGFPAVAEVRPSSDLLLPWFEVDLEGGRYTTFFALANSSAEPVDVLVSIQTHWGVPVLSLNLTLAGSQVETVDLRDWLVFGRLPSGLLGAGELAHVQAALSGRASPRDSLYYASPPAVPGRAVGSVTFRVQGTPRPDALWGDFILSDSARGSVFAEGLVNLDLMVEPRPDCSRHGLRFLAGHQGEMASELRLWTRRRGEPSATPEAPDASRVHATAEIFDEAGRLLATHELELPPVARISLLNLVGNEPFGRIDLTTGADSFAGVLVSDGKGMAMVLPAVCLPAETHTRLRLDVLINGEEALALPGPSQPVGEPIDWRYVVTNTGDAPLSGIVVSDIQGTVIGCPGEVLAPGESMTCTGMSPALACQQEISAQVTAQTPAGETVEASGFACYFGGTYGRAAIDIEVYLGGVDIDGVGHNEDADVPPGPRFYEGQGTYLRGPVLLYKVTNTGTISLSNVTMSDEGGIQLDLFCQDTRQGTLEPGEMKFCSVVTTASRGLNSHTGRAAGVTECGDVVQDQDPVYFFGERAQLARLEVHALPAGRESHTAPGVPILAGQNFLWTYVVVNSGEVDLGSIWLEHTGSPSELLGCQQYGLRPGESTTCYGSEKASPGQHQITVKATGRHYLDCCHWWWYETVGSTETVYYFGAAPAVDLEVAVNGEDADTAPGPEIPEGSPVSWFYQVTNTGNVSLLWLDILSDQGGPVVCGSSNLGPGESKTCSVTGIAAAGLQQHTAIVRATPAIASWPIISAVPQITDSDTTYYTGVSSPP